MAGREEPYDPYIPSGGMPSGGRSGEHGGTPKTAAIQAVCELVMDRCDSVKLISQRLFFILNYRGGDRVGAWWQIIRRLARVILK